METDDLIQYVERLKKLGKMYHTELSDAYITIFTLHDKIAELEAELTKLRKKKVKK